MRRFVEMPFSEKPNKNDYYLLVRKNGQHHSLEYTTEGGWNTFVDHEGVTHDDSAISSEEMAESYKCWLKPVSIGAEEWMDTIDTMLEEISMKRREYADRKLTEEEEDELDNLDELHDLLHEAMDFAERFK